MTTAVLTLIQITLICWNLLLHGKLTREMDAGRFVSPPLAFAATTGLAAPLAICRQDG